MKLDSQSGPQLATYVRYNVILEQEWLKTELGVDLCRGQARSRSARWTNPSNMESLADTWARRGEARSSPNICRRPSICAKALG